MRALPALALLAALLCSGASSAADPLAVTRESAVHEAAAPQIEMVPAKLRLSWRVDGALASVTAADDEQTTAAGTAGIEGEVALSHGEDDLIVVGGQVAAGAGDTAPLTAQQWAKLALFRGDIDYTIGHRLEWDVRPTLLAPPRLRADLNRRETIEVAFHALSMVVNDPGPLALVAVPPEHVRFGWMDSRVTLDWTAGDPAGPGSASVASSMGMIGYAREREDGGEPLEVWVFHAGAEMQMPEDADAASVMQMHFDLLRVAGARVGDFRIGGRAGFAAHSLLRSDPAGEVVESTDAMTLEPGLSIARDVGDVTWKLAAERSHWIHWSGDAIIDDRATLSMTTPWGRFRARAELFGARSHRLALGGALAAASTGGLSTLVETDLGRHAIFRVRSDVGRGFYAAGATLEDPRWAAETLATLSLGAGNR
jgi:hypothetical protein